MNTKNIITFADSIIVSIDNLELSKINIDTNNIIIKSIKSTGFQLLSDTTQVLIEDEKIPVLKIYNKIL
jgi:hypothetical protein